MLPKAWHGVWRGSLTLRPPLKNFPETPAMELRITPKEKDTCSWVLAYSGQPERRYELQGFADKPGTFILDEKNGILLDAVLENNELLTAFEVEGRLLLTRYVLIASGIQYETRTFQRGELGPHKVASWKSQSLQSALLKRS
ncbi:MAG: hypothetical protein NTX57_16090 [Armatimonadetes bacterium]|nr:hypothetical protein [Armatimonadota bacterium]